MARPRCVLAGLVLGLGALAGWAAEAEPPVRVAVVPRRGDDWRTAGVARATRSALARIPRVYASNAAVAQKLVPTQPRTPLEKLSDAGRLLRARFVVVVDVTGADEAQAELVRVKDPERQAVATRQTVHAKAPLHRLPGALALKLAAAMRLKLNVLGRARVAEPALSNDAACEALWKGDLESDLIKKHGLYILASQRDPDAALVHNRLGTVFARLGQPHSAITAFDRATRLRDDYAAAYTNCGHVLREQKRWKEADVVFCRAIALGAKSATPYIGRARLLDRVGNTLAAVDQLEKAVEIDPCHIDAMLTLSEFYFEQRDIRSAKRLTQRLLELEPKHVAALNTRGLLHLADRAPLVAEGSFRAALKIAPKSAASQANLGLALFAQKRGKEAIAALEKAAALDHRDGKPHFYLGRVYLEQKEYQKAIDQFQLAVELNPKQAAARAGLREARAAKLRGQQQGCGCGATPRMTQASRALGALFLAAILLGPHAVRLRRRRRSPSA